MHLTTFIRLASGVGVINVLDRIIGLGLGVFFARWLGVENYGVYTFVMSVVVLLLILARVGLPDLLMRELAGGRGTPRKLIVTSGALVGGTALVLVVVVSVLALLFMPPSGLRTALLIGLWLLPFRALLEIVSFAFRGLQRPIFSQSVGALFPSLLTLTLVSVLAWFSHGSPSLAIGGRLFATIVVLVVASVLLNEYLKKAAWPFSQDMVRPRAMWRMGLPFMLIGGTSLIMSRTDVVMLGVLQSPVDVGIYNVALQGALLIQLVLSTSNTIVTPEFSRLYVAENRASLQRFAMGTARITLVVALPIVALLVAYGEAILGTIFGPEFAAGARILDVLAIGYFVSLIFGAPGFLLNMTGNTGRALRITLSAAALNIILNVLFIPMFGAIGAAWATTISMFFMKLRGWIEVRRLLAVSSGIFGGVSKD